MFENYWGNPHVVRALAQMLSSGRLPQTLLFAGPEGVGKATLARRVAAALMGHRELIERDDLSLGENAEVIAARERWPADKRNQDPLLFASYPDFITFPPDGPLRQISIEQTRLLKERAPYKPMSGRWRVFLIDHVDRAGEQAANSLLKTLEEPPDHLVLILTAENSYDLLPTIRSRAVPFHFAALSDADMREFVRSRKLDEPERRIALAAGSPGLAAALDPAEYDRRRSAMLLMLRVAAGLAPFSEWIPVSEGIARSKSEKLEPYLKVLYGLLQDLLRAREPGAQIRNQDIAREITRLASAVSFDWFRGATEKADLLAELVRRNIQKTIALDSFIVELRSGQFVIPRRI